MAAKKIAIIGLGQMGSAIAFPAIENGNDVRLVGTSYDDDAVKACIETGKHPRLDIPFPEGGKFYYCSQWKEAVDGADFVIGAVSSFGVDWFLDEILSNLSPTLPVISATKGLVDLEDGSLISYPEYWERGLKEKGIRRSISAIGGPCTAYELMHHDQTEVAFCGRNATLLRMMRKALQTSYFHISLTKDVLGLESAVALKNVYALAVSMAIGSSQSKEGKREDLHFNSQAGVFYQATREMLTILQVQKADTNSFMMGVGDLYVTVSGGRTTKLRMCLGEGKTLEEALKILDGMTFESLVIIKRVMKAVERMAQRGMLDTEDFPLLRHVYDVVENGADPDNIPWDKFTFEHV